MQRGKVSDPSSKEDGVSKEAHCPGCDKTRVSGDYDGPLLRNGGFRVGTCMRSWKVGRGNPKLCPWIRGHEALTKAALLLPRTWQWVWIECNPHTASPTRRHWGCRISNSAIMFLHVSPSHCPHGTGVQVSLDEKKASRTKPVLFRGIITMRPTSRHFCKINSILFCRPHPLFPNAHLSHHVRQLPL